MKWLEIEFPAVLTGAQFLCVLTDQVVCGVYEGSRQFRSSISTDALDEEKLLELRIFDQDRELRVFRSYTGEDFKVRYLDDTTEDVSDFYDEEHYLDQDSTKTFDLGNGFTRFVTTGGGAYELPVSPSFRKVRVRTYLKESLNGLQYAGDWRILEYVEDTTKEAN